MIMTKSTPVRYKTVLRKVAMKVTACMKASVVKATAAVKATVMKATAAVKAPAPSPTAGQSNTWRDGQSRGCEQTS
jgi:hypothetical protein